MKNQNLKDAFRALDRERAETFAHIPLEELYYSPEYEKKMNRLLGKKKAKAPFAWKQFGKQATAFALGAAVAAGIAFGVTYGKEPETIEEYPFLSYYDVDFVDAQYIVNSPITSATASELGYAEGTYEYEYLTALSDIAYYTTIARNYVSRAQYAYSEEQLMGCFFAHYVSKEEICAPYEAIINHSLAILEWCDFAPAKLSYEMISEYSEGLPYEKNRACVTSCLGLSLGNIHEKLMAASTTLLNLNEKYPEYQGAFHIEGDLVEKIEELKKTCLPVYDNKEIHMKKWLEYYATIEPTLIVEEKFIGELDVVKITVTGNGIYCIPELSSRVIEDYRYETFVNTSGYTQKSQIATESVTIYMPVSAYMGANAIDTDLYIAKYNDKGKYFEDHYQLTLDPAEYYSNEPIAMKNASLDALLRGYFGGDYSERDLLGIQGVLIQYFEYDGYPSKPFEVMIDVWDGTRFRTLSCVLDVAEVEDAFIKALAEDLGHFHGLCYFRANGDANRFVSEKLIKDLNPYYVNPDDTN